MIGTKAPQSVARIAMVANAEIRYFLIDLARLLKDRHGSRIHLYCNTDQDVRFYRDRDPDGVFASIERARRIVDPVEEPTAEADADLAKARYYEQLLGLTYNTLAVGNRHFGRGYALAGFYHPRSRYSEQSTYGQMVRSYNAVFAYWERVFADRDVTLVLGGSSECGHIAAAKGIPFRQMKGSRTRNLHYWATDVYGHNPAIERAFQACAASQEQDAGAVLDQPYDLANTLREEFVRGNNVFGLLGRLGHHALRRTYWRLRGYEKAKGYYALDELRFMVRHWTDTRRMLAPRTERFAEIRGKPYVFYALGTEPETALGVSSPEFFFQHAAIAALSRDLPAGYLLAVKETMHGVGRRPANFYDQIGELKNVVWLDMIESGLEVARHATAVAVITSTVGFEAAILGTPVISFGRHNLYNFLPHVHAVTDLGKQGSSVRAALDPAFDRTKAKRDGSRFLHAVVETSFDMGDYDYVDFQRYDPATVERAGRALLGSLSRGLDPVTTARAAGGTPASERETAQ
ncbi:MAG: hypothetical protein QF926_02120 [Alphaproteobacteria bacterium]|jgi:hypothetical protein|nr:hypothetical protein [Alphaproteobacteria bacterium]MDP6515406.1 hypothetical protein [Alphaproteobacteria bacterium]